ncbi:hypothetical protein [Rhodobacter capsulatus]|uniref:hypothetical protein n=1 Tax=Rhodobacter capsulatus TaxID=1061 RepID=UPI004027C359
MTKKRIGHPARHQRGQNARAGRQEKPDKEDKRKEGQERVAGGQAALEREAQRKGKGKGKGAAPPFDSRAARSVGQGTQEFHFTNRKMFPQCLFSFAGK